LRTCVIIELMSNELILQYQKDPTNKEIEQKLLDMHGSYIKANINKWAGIVPDIIIHSYGKKYALDAFKTYNPIKGSINTHLYNNISQLSRLIYQHQNAIRLPEQQIQLIGKVNASRDILTDELGREPTTEEIADNLSLPKAHIAKVIRNQRADFLNDSDTDMQHAYGDHDNEIGNKIFQFRQTLNDTRKDQFDSFTGYNNVTPLSPQQFGLKFKLKPYEVSRLKTLFAKGLK